MAPRKELLLSDIVNVSTRFQRSVNLVQDYSPETEPEGYVITPTARKALRIFLDGLEEDGPYRSLTLTGPYGVGKSAFALFLSRLLCAGSEIRDTYLTQISDQDPSLGEALSECPVLEHSKKGFLPILITARRISAAQCILEGFVDSLSGTKSRKLKEIADRLSKYLERNESDASFDTRKILDELAKVSAAAKEAGYAGTLLIVDELGKLFEYAARDSKKGDVYILQEIAEYASRSGDNPFMVIGLLHQGFDEYARHLDLVTRQEWTKIQGRFTDIAFQEPTEQVIRLIASAISLKGDSIPADLSRHLRHLARTAGKSGIRPPVMGASEFEDLACKCFPLHPATLVALPILFNRFAQNERSLFSYLNSLEPSGFQEFLQLHKVKGEKTGLIRLPDLFDYFTINFGAGLYRQPHARRWLEAADALDRQEDLGDTHRELVKTIGVLSVLGEFSHLRATDVVLSTCINDDESMSKATEKGIKDLQESSLVVFRRFNGTYRVWEGSDIDIEDRISDGERKISQTGLSAIIQRYLVNRPMVARRHSFETGAIRYFNLVYVDTPSEISFPKDDDQRADGQIVVCLAETSADAQAFKKRALDANLQGNTLFALPQDIGDLRAAATELGSLRWVWDNTPELRDDRVARREIALRITEAEQLLQRTLTGLLDPRPQPVGSQCLWFFGGKERQVKNRAAVSQLLSNVCDELYNRASKIRNELICRRSLSSAAAGARRSLLEAMLTNPEDALLGIQGFPPERSIYESVLNVTGLHCLDKETGKWHLQPPPKDNASRLRPCWDLIEKTVFSPEIRRVQLVDLFNELANAPYGLPDGVHPILFTAFYLLNQDEMFLYREDSFVPDIEAAHLELLQRRPDLFSVSGVKLEGTRKAVVERLATGLKQPPKTAAVVRALYRVLNTLPPITQKTAQIEQESVIRMRDCLLQATSPEQLLFVDLPQCFDLETFTQGQKRKEDMELFFDHLNRSLSTLGNHALKVIQENRDILLEHCGLPPGMDGWHELERRSMWLAPRVKHEILTPFLNCINNGVADNHNARPALSLIANRPFEQWTDMDLQSFAGVAQGIGGLFRQAWSNYGDPGSDLTKREKERKETLRKALENEIGEISEKNDSKALAAALRELLIEVESRNV